MRFFFKFFNTKKFFFCSNSFAPLVLLLAFAIIQTPAHASKINKTVAYDLTVEKKPVNLSGKKTVEFSLMVNGSIPAPTLEFTEGDEAEITVHNKLENEEVSMHWHGILLPPEEDGVAYVNTPPIFAGKSHTFRFKIRQHGTYWYHSHTMVQEQKGVYGAIVIHPKKPTLKYDKDLVVVLSDWSDENADQIIHNLRKDGDYYLYKKDSMRSYIGAWKSGGLKNHLGNEWIRMGGMDLSDVGYDAFLINGKRHSQLLNSKMGERIRIRIVNAAASSYFYVSLGGLPFQVISADGVDIKSTITRELLMGMAETYDILFTVPEEKNYELRATCQDVTGYASGWIGAQNSKTVVAVPDKPLPDFYAGMAMDHSAHAGHDMGGGAVDHSKMDHSKMDHSKMDHSKMNHAKNAEIISSAPKTNTVIETLTVDDLQSATPTTLPKDAKRYELKLVLGGDMERYVWHINGKAIHQDRLININEGDVVQFTFQNDTMMHHPMHLHGHFFRVLNKFGEYSPLKHTVDVPPHGTRTIEFYANEPGQWMLHCHNLYHMKTGMARVVKYTSYTPKGEMAKWDKKDPHMHEHLYHTGDVELSTNHAKLGFRLLRTWDTLNLHLETRDYDNADHIEGDLTHHRWFSTFFHTIVGVTHVEEFPTEQTRAIGGFGYTLPMLIEIAALVDSEGESRLDLHKRFQWSKYIFSDAEVVMREYMDTEYEISLMYAHAWNWSAGFKFTEDDAGVGVIYKF